jgi:predicted anti-sigma-YlaC factor YlaD
MLSCKDVAHLASDYLDKDMGGTLPWKIRMHLVACRSCRRFIKHLKLTQKVVPYFVHKSAQEIDAEAVLIRIKARS